MSYSVGEALALTRLQAVSGFSAVNTSRGKWDMLNTGKAAIYAVLYRPRPFQRAVGHTGLTKWTTLIQVWQSFTKDGTSYISLCDAVDAVIAAFDPYPHLGNPAVVEDSRISAGSEVKEMWTKGGGGPAWLMVELTLEWTERTTINMME